MAPTKQLGLLMVEKTQQVIIYTDGSCHTQQKIGAWASIIFVNNQKLTITGIENNTTHNRMELTAIIESINFLEANRIHFGTLAFYTDSQYVAGLPLRKQKLQQAGFHTKSGNLLQNSDLLEQLFVLLEKYTVTFYKVRAHLQKTATVNYNIEADTLVRKILREQLRLNDG